MKIKLIIDTNSFKEFNTIVPVDISYNEFIKKLIYKYDIITTNLIFNEEIELISKDKEGVVMTKFKNLYDNLAIKLIDDKFLYGEHGIFEFLSSFEDKFKNQINSNHPLNFSNFSDKDVSLVALSVEQALGGNEVILLTQEKGITDSSIITQSAYKFYKIPNMAKLLKDKYSCEFKVLSINEFSLIM